MFSDLGLERSLNNVDFRVGATFGFLSSDEITSLPLGPSRVAFRRRPVAAGVHYCSYGHRCLFRQSVRPGIIIMCGFARECG